MLRRTGNLGVGMNYSLSVETDRDAYSNFKMVERAVESVFKQRLGIGVLGRSPIKLRYIPIIMPESLLASYPARSRVRKNEVLYDCAPHLDYGVFLDGTFNEQLREYLRGLDEAVDGLRKLGADSEVTLAFETLLDDCFAICSHPKSTDRRMVKLLPE